MPFESRIYLSPILLVLAVFLSGCISQEISQTQKPQSPQESVNLEPSFNIFSWNIQDVGYGDSLGVSKKYLDSEGYHTIQSPPKEGGIRLSIKEKYSAGYIFEYDVDYISGQGNRMSRIVINDQPVDEVLRSWRGAIGYWDATMGFGNELGKYHVKIRFEDTGATITVTQPSGSSKTEFVSLLPPYIFGFETRTGGNGAINVVYSNFKLT